MEQKRKSDASPTSTTTGANSEPEEVEYELHPRIVQAREFANANLKKSALAQVNRWDLYMFMADFADASKNALLVGLAEEAERELKLRWTTSEDQRKQVAAWLRSKVRKS